MSHRSKYRPWCLLTSGRPCFWSYNFVLFGGRSINLCLAVLWFIKRLNDTCTVIFFWYSLHNYLIYSTFIFNNKCNRTVFHFIRRQGKFQMITYIKLLLFFKFMKTWYQFCTRNKMCRNKISSPSKFKFFKELNEL